MNPRIMPIFAVLMPLTVMSQSSSQNYTLAETLLDPQGSHALQSVQYYDGFGRPSVSVSKGVSPSGAGVYSLREYDGLGRESDNWLPVASGSSLDYVSAQALKSLSSSFYSDSRAYTHSDYDSRSRVVMKQGAGESWWNGSHAQQKSYRLNNQGEVKKYTAPCDGSYSLLQSGFYNKEVLTVEEAADEDGKSVLSYKDIL